MTPSEIDRLARKWRDGTLTESERMRFEQWYQSFDDSILEIQSDEGRERLQQRLYQHIAEKGSIVATPKGVKRRWLPYVAAVCVLSCAIGLYIGLQQPSSIRPGGNRATLVLSDGSAIPLSDAQSGIVMGNGITYPDGSKVLTTEKNLRSAVTYATLRTPIGGTYQITLSDGTHVWLNANSTLHYPIHFDQEERVVELQGEAFFSVTPLPSTKGRRPFLVQTEKQTVEVWGTQFNVSAYSEEPEVRTTLVEGAVRVVSKNTATSPTSLRLQPSEQAILSGHQLTKTMVDVTPYIAWRDGYFSFDKESITSIMHKISRWYDVEVVYEGPIPEDVFGGTITRFEDIQEVLNLLESTGKVHFTVKGRRVTVMK